MILTLYLDENHKNQKIEILFKYFVNNHYPSNETIINGYVKKYPILKPLYLVTRKILRRHQLDDPGLFGINNIGLLLMFVGFLQKILYQNLVTKT